MSAFENRHSCPQCSFDRRQILRAGACLAALGASALWVPVLSHAEGLSFPWSNLMLNGSTDPYPIPWLDKNGSHNQSPGPGMEPSSIYHFKGRVARCNNFTGMGTDNRGNRIAFGAPSTDFSFMQGEYFAARAAQSGTLTHI
jgi:hypothetical protein